MRQIVGVVRVIREIVSLPSVGVSLAWVLLIRVHAVGLGHVGCIGLGIYGTSVPGVLVWVQ